MAATVAPAGPLRVTLGASQRVAITFRSSDGAAASDLAITSGLSALPAGWSSARADFACASVDEDAECQLALDYAPTAETPPSQLAFAYAYKDAGGVARTGTVAIAYESVAATWAYITDYQDHEVDKCRVSAEGTLGSCSTAAAGDGMYRPAAVAFQGDTGYVLNQGGDSITRCDVDTDGYFRDCRDSGAYGMDGPVDMVVHGTRFYMANAGNNTLSWCTVGADGGLGSDCRGAGDALFDVPFQLAVHGGRIYATQTGSGMLTVCELEADGTFSGCRDTGATLLDRPEGLSISGSHAYVTNYNGRTVTRCTLGADGQAYGCSHVATLAWASSSITVAGPHAYIAQGSDAHVLLCPVAADGSLGSCVDSGGTGLSTPEGITLR